MTALCPHCSEALSTYSTIVEREPTDVEVLVCARCDRVLGVVGRVGETRRRMEVDQIADLLDAAIKAEDEGQARTLQMVAIGELDSQFRAVDDGAADLFERIFAAHMARQREERQREQARQRERPL